MALQGKENVLTISFSSKACSNAGITMSRNLVLHGKHYWVVLKPIEANPGLKLNSSLFVVV